jgi:predicted NBD/HSP70 family sugar kinase
VVTLPIQAATRRGANARRHLMFPADLRPLVKDFQFTMTRSSKQTAILVIAIESVGASTRIVVHDEKDNQLSEAAAEDWDCSQYFEDPSGLRLIEQVIRRSNVYISAAGRSPDAIAVTLPGSIADGATIVRSTRLGILEAINVSQIFEQRNMPQCIVLHDVECMALGEARYGALAKISDVIRGHENFTFVFADEGIASAHYIGGKAYRGAGSAGRIGRLVVLPDGSYNKSFRSRGPLEMYAARPWVSTNIVGELLAEQGKVGESSTGNRAFREVVSTIAQGDWSRLTFKQIADGINTKDPVAVTVIEEAARFLGQALHSIIIVSHPEAIILAGGMISELPGFSESVISHARRFTYDVAWNKTVILPAELGRRAQVLGAAELAIELVKK